MENLDFNNKVIFVWEIFGKEYWIPQTIFNTWMIMAVLIIIALILNSKIKRFKETPTTKLQNALEYVVETFNSFVISTMGKKYSYFGKWFFGVIVFIWVSNLSGLVGVRPPTSSLATTAALALQTFVIIHFMGIKSGGILKYLKSFLEPFPLFLPINIIGDLATPLSLSFRLFGNILGGLIIMTMVYAALPTLLKIIGLPSALNFYFDVFSGSLQAFIFTTLSMTFISNKIGDEEGEI